MGDGNWQKAKEIFLAAIDVPPHERERFLADTCGPDSSLIDEVRSLLVSHESLDDFIETPAFSIPTLVADASALIGKELGNYRVVSEIGHGGMGSVFLGERTDGEYKHQVAIKVVRPGLDTADVRRRFLHERQILAGLEHPYIARLIDGGTTPDGLPFLVMEYVQGEPITEYAKRLSLNDRLRLFQKVCEAVAYAHRSLVIHRDLKPSNMFVTADGQPKLLDFGIAKLLDDTGSSDGTLTNFGAFTPDYASPEQIRGGPITTASDVYSLGVILCEMLAGTSPYRFETRSPDELVRVICEESPSSPSRLLSAGAIDPMVKPGELEGDLENIVLLALRKEPERRYSSVEQFAGDIQRHLDGLPVMAREDTVGYRASKFVQRHKYGVGMTAAILLILIAGIVTTAWQASVARSESRKAQRINTFLQDMLGSASPEAKGADIKVRDALDEASRRVREEFADEPEVVADVLKTIGRTYVGLDISSRAETELKGSIEASLRSNGEFHPTTAESLAYLGIALGYQRKFVEGEEVSRRAVDICRRVYPGGHENLGVALFALATNLLQKGDAAAAEPFAVEASEVVRSTLGERHGYYLATLTTLAVARGMTGNAEGSEELLRRAVSLENLIEPRFRIFIAQASVYLGRLLLRKKAFDEAETYLEKSRAIYAEVLGEETQSTAGSLQALGELHVHRGEYQRSETELREALRIFATIRDHEPLVVNQTTLLLGITLTRLGKLDEAERLLRQTLEERTKIGSAGSAAIGVNQIALGECLAARKRFADAEAMLTDGYNILLAAAGEQDPRTVEAKERLTQLRVVRQK